MAEVNGSLVPVADYFTLCKVGLMVEGEPSFDQWKQMFDYLEHVEGAIRWWIGDLLIYGQAAFGEESSQALPLSQDSCQDCQWVAGRFGFTRRRVNLTWAHHREVAGMEPVIADALLDEAEREGWSRQELRNHMRDARHRQERLVLPDGCNVGDLQSLVNAGKKFGCIYADPPWPYGNQATRAATDNHYDSMTLEDLAGLPVAALAKDQSHLHLWTTNGFLREAFGLIDAWGFTYKSAFVWCKRQMGIGNYWRVSHEFLLLGVRGELVFADKSLMSYRLLDRTAKHSSKPAEVRASVERASPGPYLELFGRRKVKGWVVWGNEIRGEEFRQEAFA